MVNKYKNSSKRIVTHLLGNDFYFFKLFIIFMTTIINGSIIVSLIIPIFFIPFYHYMNSASYVIGISKPIYIIKGNKYSSLIFLTTIFVTLIFSNLSRYFEFDKYIRLSLNHLAYAIFFIDLFIIFFKNNIPVVNLIHKIINNRNNHQYLTKDIFNRNYSNTIYKNLNFVYDFGYDNFYFEFANFKVYPGNVLINDERKCSQQTLESTLETICPHKNIVDLTENELSILEMYLY